MAALCSATPPRRLVLVSGSQALGPSTAIDQTVVRLYGDLPADDLTTATAC